MGSNPAAPTNFLSKLRAFLETLSTTVRDFSEGLERMISRTVKARLLREGADWFRRMGNANAEVASERAASRLRPGMAPRRDVIVLPSTGSGRRAGGLARAAALTPERRREIAKKAAAKRWSPA